MVGQQGYLCSTQTNAMGANQAKADHQNLESVAKIVQKANIAAPKATPNEVQGKKLAEYRILRRLGNGCFGTVYLAEHEQTKALVAIKEVPPSPNTKDIELEAQLQSKLKHPNVVNVCLQLQYSN